MTPYFFIFGLGYTAKALTPALIAQGFSIIGTSRMPEASEDHHSGVKLIHFDALDDIVRHLSLTTHLLISIPPTSMANDIVLTKYADLLKKQAPHLKWVGYLSSTGVYGDHQGNWVSEDSACIPHTPTGIARLKAEKAWHLFAEKHQLPLHIFRLSGIYGQGRNVLQRLICGKKQSIFKENQVFSRIHVADIVTTLLASIHRPNPLSLYNVSDDEPAPAHEVDLFAANLLHRDAPDLIPFSKAQLSPMEREFYENNRRVSNTKIKQALSVTLKYPTYKEGLTHIWTTDFAVKN